MDKILMQNMGFYGYHGVLDAEKQLGQKFFVDAVLYTDFGQSGKTDEVGHTVSYAEVYEDVKHIVESERYNLIEALSERIASVILEKYSSIQKVMVRVKKPEAPVNGIYDYFGVEIERTRHE